MTKVLALSANEHDGTAAVHCISLQPRIRPRLLPLQACNWCSPGLAHQSESDVVSRSFFDCRNIVLVKPVRRCRHCNPVHMSMNWPPWKDLLSSRLRRFCFQMLVWTKKEKTAYHLD